MSKRSQWTLRMVKSYWMLIVIVIVAFIVTGPGINLPLLILSLFGTYKLLQKILPASLFSTHVFITMITPFVYILILQSISLVTWLFWHSFPLNINILIGLLFITVIYLMLGTRGPGREKRATISAADVASAAVVVVMFCIFVLLPVRGTGGSLLSLTNYNVDDGAHIGLLNIRLHYNVAATVGNTAAPSGQLAGSVSYPSGWPAANAAVIQAFVPTIKIGVQTFIAYVVLKVFWMLLLTYITVRSAFSIYETFIGYRASKIVSFSIAIIMLLFGAWFLIDSFFYGFFSFIPQLITVPLFILSLLQLSFLERKKNKSLLAALLLPVLLAVGSALSWLLLFPIFAIAIFLTLLNRVCDYTLKSVVHEFMTEWRRYIIFYGTVLLSLVAQLYMVARTSTSAVSGTFIKSLLLNGGINSYPQSLYGFIFIGITLFFIFNYKTLKTKQLTAITNYVVPILAFSGFIFILQMYKLHENLYYYFKTFNTVTIVGIIFCAVGFGYLIEFLAKKSSTYLAISVVLTIGLLALQFAYPGAPFYGYAHGTRAISQNEDQQIFSALASESSAYTDDEVTIFYPDSNPLLNEIGSTLVQAGRAANLCYNSVKAASFSVNLKDFNTSPITSSCSTSTHITYYVDAKYVKDVQTKIEESGLTSRVSVFVIAS